MKVLIVSPSPRKEGNSDAQEKGIVYGMGTWDKGDVYRHPSYEQSYEMEKKV